MDISTERIFIPSSRALQVQLLESRLFTLHYAVKIEIQDDERWEI